MFPPVSHKYPSPLQLPHSEDGLSVSVPEEMSLGRLLRRASSKASDLLTFNPGAGGSVLRPGLDGEIIFSKNNVCVHPAEPLPGLAEHHPGLFRLMRVLSGSSNDSSDFSWSTDWFLGWTRCCFFLSFQIDISESSLLFITQCDFGQRNQ